MTKLYQPPLGGPSDEEVEKAKKVIASRAQARDEQIRNSLLECKCGSLFKIDTIEYIQTHYYVTPYSCTGGDYWNQDEGQWKCPTCNFTNRLIGEAKDIVKLKYHFKSIKEVY